MICLEDLNDFELSSAKRLHKALTVDCESNFENWDINMLMANAAIRIERLTEKLNNINNGL